MALSFRGAAVTLLLSCTLAVQGLHANILTAMQIKTLPEQRLEQFTARIPAAVTDAKSRPVAQKIAVQDQVLVAPVVFHWAPEELGRRAFPQLWETNEHSGSVQWLTDETLLYVMDGLKARGYDAPLTSGSIKNEGVNVESMGYEPPIINGTNLHNAYHHRGYTYFSRKLKRWGAKDFAALQAQFPVIKTMINIDIASSWAYEGHGQLNREAVVNYKVNTQVAVKICNGVQCVESLIPYDKGLSTTFFIPAEVADEESRRKENNASAVKMASKFYADAVLAVIDNMVIKSAATTGASTSSPKGPIGIVSRMNGKCLDVPEGNFVAGQAVQMWDCYPGHKNQSFELTSDNQIKAGGLCLNAFGGTGKNGDRVGLWQCVGAPNEKWFMQNGQLKGINGRCIAIDAQNPNNGAPILLWDCLDGFKNELWDIR